MRTGSIALVALAGLLAAMGAVRAQTKSTAQPEGTRPSNMQPTPPGDKASDPPRNLNTPKAGDMAPAKSGPPASGVGSGSAGKVDGRKDGSTNSNSKGEAPKSK